MCEPITFGIIILSLLIIVALIEARHDWDENKRYKPIGPKPNDNEHIGDNPKNMTYGEQRAFFAKEYKAEKLLITIRLISFFLFLGFLVTFPLFGGALRIIGGIGALISLFVWLIASIGDGGGGGGDI